MKPGSLIQYEPKGMPPGALMANPEIINLATATPSQVYTCKELRSFSGRLWLQVEEMSFGTFADGSPVWCDARAWVEVQTPPNIEAEINAAITAPAPVKHKELVEA